VIKPGDVRVFQSAQKYEKDLFRLDQLSPDEKGTHEEEKREPGLGPEPFDSADPIAEAGKEADRIVSQAEETARGIIQEAEANAENIEREADSRAMDIFRQARERGRTDGADEIREQAERRYQASAQMLASFIEQMKKRETELVQSLSSRLADFAIELAGKIIHKELDKDSKLTIRQAEHAIAKMLERDKLLIRVNPSDEETMKDHKPSLIEMFDGIDKIEVIADPEVERGGCIVETDLIKVDAQPRAQLKTARSLLADENEK
jgi:flagellar assembly protein FliH